MSHAEQPHWQQQQSPLTAHRLSFFTFHFILSSGQPFREEALTAHMRRHSPGQLGRTQPLACVAPFSWVSQALVGPPVLTLEETEPPSAMLERQAQFPALGQAEA